MTTLPAPRFRLTSLPASRFRLALWAVFLGALGISLLVLGRIAHAQAVADPVATAATATDALWSVLATFGPLWGGMYVGFGAVSTALERNKSTHWIAQGRTLAVITAAVGLGIAALQAHFGGAPWSGVVMTLVLGAFKLIDPTTVTAVTPAAAPASSPAPAKSPQAGFVAPRLLLLIALIPASVSVVYALSGCGPKSTAILDAAIDCTTKARADLVVALEPTALAAIDKIKDPSTGQVTTSALQELFGKPSLTSEAGVIVGCLESKVAAVLAGLLPTGPASVAMAARVSGPPIDVTSLRQAIGEQFPGATFRTSP